LDHRNSEVRWHAARALGNIGRQPERVVPELDRLLKDDSPVVRTHAAYAAGRYGPDAAPAVPALAEALGDPEVEVRIAAARALGEIGPAAQAAVSALIRALDDASGAVTLDAADALVRIGAPAVPALVQSLNQPPLAGLVANTLGQIGPAAEAAVPALIRLIDSADDQSRREAILALAAIGPAAREAAPRLVKLLELPEEPFRAGAAYALAMLEADEAAPLLKQGLTSGDELLELASAWGLLHLDPENEAFIALVVPRLSRGLTHDRPLVRLKAAEAAAELGLRAKEALPALIAALADDQLDVRVQVLDALAAMGPEAASSVSAIAPLLDAAEPILRTAAANALGRIGPPARPAVPALERMLQRADSFEQTVAASALVRIDPRPEFVRTATPLMIDALQEGRVEVRVEAATVLGLIAGDNAGARTALQGATRDEEEAVRTAAQRALRQL
jgi:HEAT repeat protein